MLFIYTSIHLYIQVRLYTLKLLMKETPKNQPNLHFHLSDKFTNEMLHEITLVTNFYLIAEFIFVDSNGFQERYRIFFSQKYPEDKLKMFLD